jgi:LEA14-like dessication related protein
MRSGTLVAFILILASLLVGPGCALRPETEDFDVTLVNLASDGNGGGVGEAELRFTVRLQNATPEAVTLTGSAHKIYLNGVYVGQALSDARIEVPRLGTVTQDVTVHLSTFKLARAFYGIYRDQRAAYRITSTLYGTRSTLRTRKEGSIDLHGLQLPPPGTPEAPSLQP